jgi:hypothetical protein
MRRSRNLPLPAGRLDYIIFVSGIMQWAKLNWSNILDHFHEYFLSVDQFTTTKRHN